VREGKPEPAADKEDRKARFVENAGDGPSYKIGHEQRKRFYHLNVYGKEGNEPPHSYLKVKEWAVKKDDKKKDDKKEDHKGVGGRGSFVDAIFFFGDKYKYPGPDNYFKEDKDKAKTAKADEGKEKEKKKFERVNFLCDAEYLGMNIPCPGSYNTNVTSLRQ
jgi:hypothetical protein